MPRDRGICLFVWAHAQGWGVCPAGGVQAQARGGCPGPGPGRGPGGVQSWGVSRPRPRGGSRPRPRGGSRPRPVCVCVCVSQHSLRQTPPTSLHPQQTATAADSAHPTGMHSCFTNCWKYKNVNIANFVLVVSLEINYTTRSEYKVSYNANIANFVYL